MPAAGDPAHISPLRAEGLYLTPGLVALVPVILRDARGSVLLRARVLLSNSDATGLWYSLLLSGLLPPPLAGAWIGVSLV